MANVPGLIPTQDDPMASPDKLGGRVQTNDNIPQAPLPKPVAAPVNTFARAPAFTDPGLQRLADSLGQLSNGFYSFGDATAEADKSEEAKKRKQGVATQKLAGRTPDEQKQILAADPELHDVVTERFAHGIYEAARVAQEIGMGADAKQALALATLAAHEGKLDKTMPDQPIRDTMDQAKRQLSGFAGFGGLATATNADEPIRKVVTLASVLNAAYGIPMDKAIEQAAPGVKAGYIKVNGNAVFVGSREVPHNFEDLAEQYVGRYWEQNRETLEKQHISKGDLTLFAVNDTPNWMIVPRGFPHAASGTNGAGFSPYELYDIVRNNRQRADAQATSAAEHRYDPYLVIGDPDKGGLTVGPYFKNGATPAQVGEVKKAAKRIHNEPAAATPTDVLGAGMSTAMPF